MRVKLRRSEQASDRTEQTDGDSAHSPRVNQRQFLRALGALGTVAAAQLVTSRPVEAAYEPGLAPDGGDLINTSLTVQGNITVTGGNVGITNANGSYNGMVFAGDMNWGFAVVHPVSPTDDYEARVSYYSNPGGNRKVGFWDARQGLYPLYVDTSGANVLVAGNFGVGTTSSGLGVRLTVATTGGNDGLRINGNSGNWTSLFVNLGAGSYSSLTQANDRAILYGGSAVGQPGGGLVIAPWASGNGGMRLDSTGNLGVGTSNPASTLHVARGNIQIGSFLIADSGTINNPYGSVQFYKGPTNPNGIVYYFDHCGDTTANVAFWQGCLFGGPTVTVNGSPVSPRLGIYWEVDTLTNPTYIRGNLWCSNTNGLATLRLGGDAGLTEVEGTLNATSQVNVNGIKAIDSTGTALKAYYS